MSLREWASRISSRRPSKWWRGCRWRRLWLLLLPRPCFSFRLRLYETALFFFLRYRGGKLLYIDVGLHPPEHLPCFRVALRSRRSRFPEKYSGRVLQAQLLGNFLRSDGADFPVVGVGKRFHLLGVDTVPDNMPVCAAFFSCS